MCPPHIRRNSNLDTANDLKCLHRADISPRHILASPWGFLGARYSALGLWLEIRVCLRHLLTRKFGQQKAEGGGVLLNGFLSIETPWRTICYAKEPEAKCPEVGMKSHLARLNPLAFSMHLLLIFLEIVLSQVWKSVGTTKRSNGSIKHQIFETSFHSQQCMAQRARSLMGKEEPPHHGHKGLGLS